MFPPARQRDEEKIAALLSDLRSPPRAWIEAAKELPQARAEVDVIAARAELDAEYRARVLEDLERALREAGHEPAPHMVAALRAGIGDR